MYLRLPFDGDFDFNTVLSVIWSKAFSMSFICVASNAMFLYTMKLDFFIYTYLFNFTKCQLRFLVTFSILVKLSLNFDVKQYIFSDVSFCDKLESEIFPGNVVKMDLSKPYFF